MEIEANDPLFSVATPTSFEIAPDLPAGLVFNTDTGRISGTPSEESPATDYVITASFPGDQSDSADRATAGCAQTQEEY